MGLFDNDAWGNSDALTFGDWNPNTSGLMGETALPSMALPQQGPIQGASNTLGNSVMSGFNVPIAGQQPSAWDKFIGGKETGAGWGKLGLGVASGIGNFYLGSKQLGLAEDQLATSKDQFNKQYGTQRSEINRGIADLASRRAARNPGGEFDADAYVEKYSV